MTSVSVAMNDQVRVRLSHEWKTARKVHDAMDCWSLVSIRHALRIMADNGQIERRDAPTVYPGVITSEYRLPQ